MLRTFATGLLLIAAPVAAQPGADTWRTMIAPASAEQVTQACAERLAAHRAARARLETLSLDAPPEQIVRAYDDAYVILIDTRSENRLLTRSRPDDPIRVEAGKCLNQAEAAMDTMRTSRPVYERLRRGAAFPETRYMVERQLDIFRRNGVERSEPEKKRLAEIRADIDRLRLEFETNIEADQRSMTLKPDETRGLSADFLASHKAADGSIVITNSAPDVFTIARFSPVRSVRQRAMIMFFNRGEARNRKVLADLLARRAEMARLLGFATYADYELDGRMARTPDAAQKFLDEVAGAARARATQEVERFHAALRKEDPSIAEVRLWDMPYAGRLARSAAFQLDPTEVATYFPYPRVREGIFRFAEKMYGVKIRPWSAPVWHDSVTAHEILEGDHVIGRFFVDPHPRPGKASGNAWTVFLRTGLRDRVIPTGAVLINAPAGNLDHGDVVVFLHEFGHLLHHVFAGQGDWAMAQLFEYETDALEAPSQMLEEWAWDPATLRDLAVSKDGKRLPPQLLERMLAARDFSLGYRTLDDIAWSAASLQLHRDAPPEARLEPAYNDIINRYSLMPDPPELHSLVSFGHLASYGAGYYTYPWSRAIAADWMSEFQARGLNDRATADRFRQAILAPGASQSVNTLTRNFLRRDWSTKAYREKLVSTGAAVVPGRGR